MSRYAAVRPPGSSTDPVDPVWIAADLERWVANEPLGDLVAMFGGSVPRGSLAEKVTYLEDFSGEHWDFRQGRERDYIDHVQLGEGRDEVVESAAAALGLKGSTLPSLSSYDHVLILGGLVRACVLRPAYAARLHHGGLTSLTTTGLTAFRPVSPKETELLLDLGLHAAVVNEVDAMQEGLLESFGLVDSSGESSGSDHEEGFATWLQRRWTAPAGSGTEVVQLVVAPSPVPDERRANSADTYEFWADQVQHLEAGERLLLVTSAIYVPYQGTDAVRVLGLPRGVSVETVGLDNSGPEHGALRQSFRAPHYLQEIRSTIGAVGRLAAAVGV